MNKEILLQHFNRISEAPDAIPRLRKFILDLAVRGKLVEQNQNDEPASELLKRIQAEKEKLGLTRRRNDATKCKKIEKPGDLAASREMPFEVSNSWAWCELGTVAIKTGSGSTPRGGQSAYQSNGIPFLRSQNVYNEGLRLTSVVFIDEITHDKMRGTAVESGDLLLNITGGSIGRCCRISEAPIQANISQHVAIIRLALPRLRDFMHRVVLSPFFQSFIVNEQTGAGREGLPKNKMDRIPIPLPPLAEQQRIVAKVDELMVLCDQLEAARNVREARRDRLVASSLNRLSTAAGEEAKDAARFHLDQLPRLITRIEHVKQLRQAILNMAVSGRLVAQDPNDEPIAIALTQNDETRKATAKQDRRADAENQKLLAAEEKWQVPLSWAWRGLADLALFIDYRGQTPTKVESGIRLITAKNVKQGVINFFPEEFLADEAYASWMSRGIPRNGDVLFTTEAPMGNAAVVRISERFALAQRVINFRLYDAIASDFLVIQFLSQPFRSILDKTATGLTAKGIKAAKLKRLPIALPPLAEQQRIVAKVDELMALCDQLEAQLTTTAADSRRLLEAVLQDALADTAQGVVNAAAQA